jgi:putative Holliday junction resolvase
MRILGLDYGARRIGIALSDAGAQFAFPHSTIPNDASAIDRIEEICNKEEVKEVVMGDTRASNNADNAITDEAELFAKTLGTHSGHVVALVREAWSSAEAARFAPKGVHDDAAAAAIILQRHLDSRGTTRE